MMTRKSKQTSFKALIILVAFMLQLLAPMSVFADIWDGSISSGFDGGSGTAADPYRIATGTQLAYLSQEQNAGNVSEDTYFILTSDIDMASLFWTPIGTDSNPFKGYFDGNGHTISNLTTDAASATQYVGMFGYSANTSGIRTKILNLGLTGASINLNNASGMAGILVGSASDTDIENCFVRGTLNSVQNNAGECIGGIVGNGTGSKICNSYSAVTITNAGATKAGGLAGVLATTTIANGLNDSTLTATGINTRAASCTGYSRDIPTSTMKASAITSKSAVSTLNYWLDMQKSTAYNTWTVTPGSYPAFGAKFVLVSVSTPSNISDADAGTKANPYRIATKENLLWISENYRAQSGFIGKYFQQTADIDMASVTNFIPIGDFDLSISSVNNPFEGTYDGNGYKIANLTMLDTVYERGAFGLFGVVGSSGVVKNVTVEDAAVTGRGRDYSSVGIIAGKNLGEVKYCKVVKSGGGSTAVRGETNNYLGAIVGNNSGTVKKCINYANVIATSSSGTTGGITGSNYGIVANCLNMANVTGSSYSGGIVGIHESNTTATNLNTGTTQTADGLVVAVLRSGQTPIGNYYYGTTSSKGIYLDQNGSPNKDQGCTLISSVPDLATEATFTSFDFVNNWIIENGAANPIPRPAVSAPEVQLTAGPGAAVGTISITINEALGAGQSLYIRKFFGANTVATPDCGDILHTNSVSYSSGTDITLTTFGQPVTRVAVYFINSMGNIEKFKMVEVTDDIVKGQISAIGNQTFTAKQEGYDAGTQQTKTLSIYNDGTSARSISNLQVALSGADADKFVISQPLSAALGLYSSTTFTVKAADNLLVGTYTATVSVKSGSYPLNQGSFTVTQTISSSPVPASLPTSGSFTDVDGDEGEIGGTVSWTAASPTTGIVGYKIYWGSDSTTKLTGSTAVIYTVLGSSTTTQAVAANTALPAGATHFLIYSYNSSGDSSNCLAVPITDAIPAPAVLPTGGAFTDTDGDAAEIGGTISWTAASPTTGITGYKVYWGSNATTKLAGNSTVVYTITNAASTSQAVSANTVLPTGASYFLIYSYGAGGNSINCLAIRITDVVPDNTAPVLTAGTVNRTGDTTGTVKFNSDEAGTYYYEIVADGASAPSIVTTGAGVVCVAGENTITNPTGLTAGAKDIYIRAKDAAGNVSNAIKIDIAAYVAPSAPSGGGSAVPPATAPGTLSVTINGQAQQAAATVSTQTQDNKTVTTVTVDENKLTQSLNNVGSNTVVTLPVATKSDVVVGELTGQMVKTMEQKDAVLEIKTENVSYTLPAAQISIENVSEQLGTRVALKDIKVSITIATPPQDTIRIVEDTANKNNCQIVVNPVEFSITCSAGNKTTEVSRFNGYVERTVAIPHGIDPSKITTGVVLNSDGTFSHVPTQITVIDGKYYAKINSLTNSTYSVIWNPKEFTDVANHWAKSAVNDMASRLIIGGYDKDTFAPDKEITRAEFAAIVVRGLGLRNPTSEISFSDVKKSGEYYDYVRLAVQYGLINGYSDGTFQPDKKISREEAIAIISRAMIVAKIDETLTDDQVSKQLSGFTDNKEVSAWAKNSAAQCIKKGIISGSNGKLNPKNHFTRAETATIVKRLLQKAKLI